MFEAVIFLAGVVCGVVAFGVFLALRLRGDEAATDTLRRIVPFAGGGPGKTPPR